MKTISSYQYIVFLNNLENAKFILRNVIYTEILNAEDEKQTESMIASMNRIIAKFTQTYEEKKNENK